MAGLFHFFTHIPLIESDHFSKKASKCNGPKTFQQDRHFGIGGYPGGHSFLRFEFNPAQCAAIKAGAAVKLGCDHTNYPANVTIAPETLASLAGDLR